MTDAQSLNLNNNRKRTRGSKMSEKNRSYSVIQDFDNKRANAHATLFVASMFGSFTLLSLVDRLVDIKVFSLSNCAIFGLLLFSYVLVGLFGAYSLLNFFLYATTSQIAERKIIEEKEGRMLTEAKKGWRGISKWFADFKERKEEGLLKGRKEDILVFLYVLIVSLPMLAFFVRFLCG
jgi:hypothetical protein